MNSNYWVCQSAKNVSERRIIIMADEDSVTKNFNFAKNCPLMEQGGEG